MAYVNVFIINEKNVFVTLETNFYCCLKYKLNVKMYLSFELRNYRRCELNMIIL